MALLHEETAPHARPPAASSRHTANLPREGVGRWSAGSANQSTDPGYQVSNPKGIPMSKPQKSAGTATLEPPAPPAAADPPAEMQVIINKPSDVVYRGRLLRDGVVQVLPRELALELIAERAGGTPSSAIATSPRPRRSSGRIPSPAARSWSWRAAWHRPRARMSPTTAS